MLAAIVTSYNDSYKLKEWREHFDEMKAVIDEYIIVDNGSSDTAYLSELKSSFPEATLLELGENKGTTGAYNAGIRYLLRESGADYIMLIGNDIRITPESIEKQIAYLDTHREVGMVAPVLLKKDSMEIEDGGCSINPRKFTLNPSRVGDRFDEIDHRAAEVDAVTGGMNIAKRSFYETMGLQDEALFMYSDEVDMGLRAREKGIKMALVAEACAWHQHINPQNNGLRHPYSAYLMGRNKVYLAWKHGPRGNAASLFLQYLLEDTLRMGKALLERDPERCEKYRWHIIGAYYGLRRDMGRNRYSSIGGTE